MGNLILLFFLLVLPIGCDAYGVAGEHQDPLVWLVVGGLILCLGSFPRTAGWRESEGLSRWEERNGVMERIVGPSSSYWQDGSPGAPAVFVAGAILALVGAALVFLRHGLPEVTTWQSVWGSVFGS